MRTPDRRTEIGRRGFLQATTAAVPAAALATAGLGISAKAAWALDAKAFDPHGMATLVLMARDIFPHDSFGDALYVVAVQPWDEKASTDAAFKDMLDDGIKRLDTDAQNRFGGNYLSLAWETDRVTILQGITDTPFFKKCRGDLVVSLYNQPAVWKKLGYEGSSAEYGGYIHRGFDDIDWLPAV